MKFNAFTRLNIHTGVILRANFTAVAIQLGQLCIHFGRFDDKIKSKHPCDPVLSATQMPVRICFVNSSLFILVP